MAAVELTHMERLPIDMALAERQHADYRAALAAAGAEVTVLPALAAHPDCSFVEDIAVILPECSIVCRPGSQSRRGEVASIAAVLPDDRPVEVVAAPGTIDGGDVLVVGREIFVGLSSRTNAAAVAMMAAIVGRFGYRVVGIPLAKALHLKTAVTALAQDLLLINTGWVDARLFGKHRHVAVAEAEPFAANSLRVGGTLFHGAGQAATTARIVAAGIPVTCLEFSEFAKAEAGLTCLSLIVPPAA